MKHWIAAITLVANLSALHISLGKDGSPDATGIRFVPFHEVEMEDPIWRPRIRTLVRSTLPHAFQQTEVAQERLRLCADWLESDGKTPKPDAHRFNTSDLYKVMEGAALMIRAEPNAEVEAFMDRIINVIARAQQDDGYLYLSHITGNIRVQEMGPRPYSYLLHSHELYNMGHLYEAAVAYAQATGKTKLLDVAEKNARHVDRVLFQGDPKYNDGQAVMQAPGHQEIELGLIKLYNYTGNRLYLTMAKRFLDIRGVTFRPDGSGVNSARYAQQHLPVAEQTEAVGHAVRATYQYAAMAEVDSLMGTTDYSHALESIWTNIVDKRMHITGGLGAVHGIEGFGPNYELPNKHTYLETCAAVGNVFFNMRMFLKYRDARYLDVAEIALLNNCLSGMGIDGKSFFYPNPLEADANHRPRSAWFGTACCPSNIARLIPQVSGYMYAVDGNDVYCTLYGGNQTEIKVDGVAVGLVQQTSYPWEGNVGLTVDPERASEFSLRMRIPTWAGTQLVPGELYRYLNASPSWTLAVNGQTISPKIEKGFAVITRTWRPGDRVDLKLPMSVRANVCDRRVAANVDLVAFSRGPIVLCAEGVDNGGSVQRLFVDAVQAERKARTDSNPAGKLAGLPAVDLPAYSVALDGSVAEATAKLIPYFAWSNRDRSSMITWLPTRQSLASPDLESPENLKFAEVSASHTFEGDTVVAVRMKHTPQSSADRSIRRWTSWPQKGQSQWVEVRLDRPRSLRSIGVYFYDDQGGVQLPGDWYLETPSGVADAEGWEKLKIYNTDQYSKLADVFNVVHPAQTLFTDRFRIVMSPRHQQTCVGILAVDVELGTDDLPGSVSSGKRREGVQDQWRYTLSPPASGWQEENFDDSHWKSGLGGFGTQDTPGARIGTVWSTGDIWLRKTFSLSDVPTNPALWLHHDEDATIYLNGKLLAEFEGYTTNYKVVPIAPEHRSVLRAGSNTLAVHCHQTTGGQFIDVQVVDADHLPQLPARGGRTTPPKRAVVAVDGRWSAKRAHEWYDAIDWPVGANFVPSTAINQLEMWQAETWDPSTIDRELGWAAALGMNTMRVYLHDIPWRQDAAGYLERVDEYLGIADKHGIRTLFVIFDSVWHPHPHAGVQPAPVPGVHNSGWVQSPGIDVLNNSAAQDKLKPYVQDVLRRFKDDPRVLAWDLFNEPENTNGNSYGPESPAPDLDGPTKQRRAAELIEKAFRWGREVHPAQPLTVGVWNAGGWSDPPSHVGAVSLANSDVISFHAYTDADQTEDVIQRLKKHGRPLICTEYMARSAGSTFETILPVLSRHRVGAIHWGLVAGKSNTIYPWSSWQSAFEQEPDPWFHDVFRPDGTPYRESETEFIRQAIEERHHLDSERRRRIESGQVFLLPYFLGNGEAGVYLSYSQDGLRFERWNDGQPVLPAPEWGDESLTRDPSILYHAGIFHMVWTTSWNSRSVGYASSPNLRDWSQPQKIDVWGDRADVRNTWAPELHWDLEQEEFLILWSSTIDAEFGDGDGSSDNDRYDHRSYAIRTKDFQDFTRPELFYSTVDPELSVIDPYIALDDRNTEDRSDDRWVMVIKNEMPESKGGKNLRLVDSEHMQGPYSTTLGPAIVGAGTSIVNRMGEGPSLLKVDGEWWLYWDAPGSHYSYCLATSPDLKTWTNRSSEMTLPVEHLRHGTVVRVPQDSFQYAP